MEEEILRFVEQQAQGNRSSYINTLLAQQRRQTLAAEMTITLKQDAKALEYQAEIAAWDSVVGDGLNASE